MRLYTITWKVSFSIFTKLPPGEKYMLSAESGQSAAAVQVPVGTELGATWKEGMDRITKKSWNQEEEKEQKARVQGSDSCGPLQSAAAVRDTGSSRLLAPAF